MGANVATFSDTFAAALLLNSPDAIQVALAEIIGDLIVTLIALLFYGRFYDLLVKTMNFILLERKALLAFVAFLFLFPLTLLFL